MPETRQAAAKRRRLIAAERCRGGGRRRHSISSPLLLELLPREILPQILNYLDVVSLSWVAGCNTTLRNLVYNNEETTTNLWRIIDFGSVPPETAARITDGFLRQLFRNINAVEHCQVLKLKGCVGITGSGLDALVGSRVLREADLRLMGRHHNGYATGPVELDLDSVLPMLSSMPPIAPGVEASVPERSLGLSLVKFCRQEDSSAGSNYYDQFDDRVDDWLRHFHDRLRAKAVESRFPCGYCGRAFADVLPFDDLQWVMSTAYCECCTKYTCGSYDSAGTRCPNTRDCRVCLIQCCQPMALGQPYGDKPCPTHKMVYNCESCDGLECEDCFDGVMCSNDECVGCYCQDCRSNNRDIGEVCEDCDDDDAFYCPECIVAHREDCHDSDDSE